jgi:hypothetical protein
MTNDRRHPSSNSMVKWIGLAVGLFSIVGVLVGAGISYGQHIRADQEQDGRLKQLEERVRDLERADGYLHGDQGLLPHAR